MTAGVITVAILAFIVLFCWDWIEERGSDILAIGGYIVVGVVLCGMVWLVHWLIHSWILSVAIVILGCLAWYKHNG